MCQLFFAKSDKCPCKTGFSDTAGARIATEAGTHPSYVSHSALREAVVKNELVVTFCFDLSVDKTTRKLGVKGIESFLKELKWNSNVATVYAFSDFSYTANLPLIEQEYLKLSRETFAVPGLAGKDGFIILHVHYSGKWRASDTQAVSMKRGQSSHKSTATIPGMITTI